MRFAKVISAFLIVILTVSAFSSCASSGGVNNKSAGRNSDDTYNKSTNAEKDEVIGHGDYPIYTSLNDLVKKADYIIYGTVLSNKYEDMSLRISDDGDDISKSGEDVDDSTAVTVFEVSVIESYTPLADKNDIIYVLTLGGETEDTIYKFDGSPDIATGQKYIFFLQASSIVKDGAWLLNDTQSLYPTDGVNITGGAEFNLSFEELEKLMKE